MLKTDLTQHQLTYETYICLVEMHEKRPKKKKMRKCMHFETVDYKGLIITTKTTMQKAV